MTSSLDGGKYDLVLPTDTLVQLEVHVWINEGMNVVPAFQPSDWMKGESCQLRLNVSAGCFLAFHSFEWCLRGFIEVILVLPACRPLLCFLLGYGQRVSKETCCCFKYSSLKREGLTARTVYYTHLSVLVLEILSFKFKFPNVPLHSFKCANKSFWYSGSDKILSVVLDVTPNNLQGNRQWISSYLL